MTECKDCCWDCGFFYQCNNCMIADNKLKGKQEMKKNDFRGLIDQTFLSIVDLTGTKGEEYSRSVDDQLANFRRDAADYKMTVPQVIGLGLNKHLNSVKTFIVDDATGNKRVLSEPIEGRIDDVIMYLLLLKAAVRECKG